MHSMIRNLLLVLTLALAVSTDEVVPSYSTDCVLLNGTITLTVNYTGSDDKPETDTRTFSKDATVSGTCGNKTSTLKLVDDDKNQILTFTFSSNSDKANKLNNVDPLHWGVTNIKYEYDIDETDAKHQGDRIATATGSYFVTPLNMSYSCSKDSVVLVNVTDEGSNSTALIPGEQVILGETGLTITIGPSANGTRKDDTNYHYCKADQKIKDVVPIAVGAALAALVVIVLVAYLIGRRRTVTAGGYERV